MLTMGVNDPAEALEQLKSEGAAKESGTTAEARLINALRYYKESLIKKENDNGGRRQKVVD